MRAAAAAAEVLGRSACIVDSEALPKVQAVCDGIPRILEAWDLLADLSAALDNVLLHHAGAMPLEDALRRRHLVDRAERLLSAE